MVTGKLNSLDKIMSKALINSNITHEEFTQVINGEQNYFSLKDKTWRKDDQLSDTEQDRLTEHGKSTGQNERLSLKLTKNDK